MSHKNITNKIVVHLKYFEISVLQPLRNISDNNEFMIDNLIATDAIFTFSLVNFCSFMLL